VGDGRMGPFILSNPRRAARWGNDHHAGVYVFNPKRWDELSDLHQVAFTAMTVLTGLIFLGSGGMVGLRLGPARNA
jgi:hypothetical protein